MISLLASVVSLFSGTILCGTFTTGYTELRTSSNSLVSYNSNLNGNILTYDSSNEYNNTLSINHSSYFYTFDESLLANYVTTNLNVNISSYGGTDTIAVGMFLPYTLSDNTTGNMMIVFTFNNYANYQYNFTVYTTHQLNVFIDLKSPDQINGREVVINQIPLYTMNQGQYYCGGYNFNYSVSRNLYLPTSTNLSIHRRLAIGFSLLPSFLSDLVNTGNLDYTTGYNNGYNSGYDSGYQNGTTDGYTTGYDNGVDTGFNSGYANGYTDGQNASNVSFMSLFGTIADTPVMMIRSLFAFDLFGTPMLTIILSLFTAILIIHVAKKVIK